MEDIKLLKENHVFLKNNWTEPSKFFNQFSKKFKQTLSECAEVSRVFNFPKEDEDEDDMNAKTRRTELVENFTETLIYERIGHYLYTVLLGLHLDGEMKFREKLNYLHDLHTSSVHKFNQLLGCQLQDTLEPQKSA